MSTSPTALASSSPSSSPVPVLSTEAAKLPVLPFILAVVAGVVVASLVVGGGVYYLARSGRLSGSAVAPRRADPIAPEASHIVLLEPLLVNLADAGDGAYLKVALALRVLDSGAKLGATAKEEKGKDSTSGDETLAPVRDTVLSVCGRQTSDELLATSGKDHLRAALRDNLAKRNPELKVKDVFFTDFLVQR